MSNSNPIYNAASVIVPIYNAEKYLDEAIQSILNQSFGNFELLLLNDGSTDSTLDILHKYALKDKRCKVINNKNQGIVATLNHGLELAQNEIVFRMDADDVCLPKRFEQQMLYLNNNPSCVALGTQMQIIDPEGLPIREDHCFTEHHDIDQRNISGKGQDIFHPTVAYKKSIVIRLGGYRKDFEYAEDLDLFLRMAEVGKLSNLDECLLRYRQHSQSIGYKRANLQRASAKKAIIDACKRRGCSTPKNFIYDNIQSDTNTILSSEDTHMKWAWWALQAGNISTARKHAIKSLLKSPFNTKNYKLLFCTLRGY